MLSAILVRLKQISTSSGESANEELLQIVPLLVSAHPDLKPTVVRGAFLGAASVSQGTDRHRHQRRTAYYRYLSLLLDADEGVDSARSDRRLIEVSLGLGGLVLSMNGVGSGGQIKRMFNFVVSHPFASSFFATYIKIYLNDRRSGAIYRLSYTRNL